jgi:hypothetical protein
VALHPFDQAIALRPAGPDTFTGQCGRLYWNSVGPFGGISAATMLHAVMQHPAMLGEPASLTVNYASGVAEGPFAVVARPVRTNRSTQHWMVEMQQPDGNGVLQTVLTATALTVVRRATWGASDVPMPLVQPPVGQADDQRMLPLEWLRRYDTRQVLGAIPTAWDGSDPPAGDAENASLSCYWMRDNPPRPLDFCSLASFADVFFPRVYLRRALRVPAGTVSMTVYFHVRSQALHACGDTFVLGQARGQFYHDGFFDQTVQLWSQAGVPLASSTQIVYYKE